MLTSAQTKVEIDGIWYNLITKGKVAEVISSGGTEYSGSITLPATITYNGVTYSVTNIADYAFSHCRSLTSVTLPEGVTSIGVWAFHECSNLESITIPKNSKLTNIGDAAFYYCSSLTAISIPKSVNEIGAIAFAYCSSLVSITIPEGITEIKSGADGAFANCRSLTEINIPESVTTIGGWAFQNCNSLTEINIPGGVTDIGENAFYGCNNLTSIVVDEDNTVYDSRNNCNAIIETVSNTLIEGCSSTVIPMSVTGIGENAFSGRNSLTSITIPASVNEIGSSAFSSCNNLTIINLPEGVTSIGDYAFAYCNSLATVVLPKGVEYIGYEAFANCPELTDVYCNAESFPSTAVDAFDGSYPEYATLHVPAVALNAYQTTAPWSSFGTIVSLSPSTAKVEISGIWYNLVSKTKQAEVTFKGNDAWDYDEYSGTITIPTTVTYEGIQYRVTSIGDYAFGSCYYLTSITIPTSVTSIGYCAFEDCSSFADITISQSVTSIGNSAFSNCHSLVAINIPEGVTSIGDAAFAGCSSLITMTVAENNTIFDSRDGCNAIIETNSNTLIAGCATTIIPEGVTNIGDNAFRNCSNLTAIAIPEGVMSIGDEAFRYCSNLTAIAIPEGVTSIGGGAFAGCSSLTNITIPKSVTSIENEAFYGCCSLTTIIIPEGVTDIGNWFFYGCSSLTAITIPESVTNIGIYAFGDCSSLTTITIPKNVMSIGYSAFSSCSSLTAITIPESVTSIGEWTFKNCSRLTTITIPESVTRIIHETFAGCKSLATVRLPKKMEYIGPRAFANCPELLDVYCSAETVPSTEADAFEGSYIEHATLHVPAVALNDYKSTAPWNSFGTINSATNEPVQSITLNRQSATMTEGNTLTLTATITPIYATDRTLTWSSSNPSVATVDNTGKVTAIAPGTATIIAAANDGSGVSASCEVTVTEATYVEITINQYGSGTYCSPYALDFSNVEGLKAYAATGYNSRTGVVTLTRVMTTQPGEGLFIKGNQGKYVVPIMESTDDHTINMLKGTLTETSMNATSGLYANYKYTIKEGDSQPLFYRFADGSTLGAGKAYLQIPTAWLPAEAKSISLRFEEGEGTTDIENSQFTIDNSQLIFDLYGRRVDNPVKGGIYIVGGKKVVM